MSTLRPKKFGCVGVLSSNFPLCSLFVLTSKNVPAALSHVVSDGGVFQIILMFIAISDERSP